MDALRTQIIVQLYQAQDQIQREPEAHYNQQRKNYMGRLGRKKADSKNWRLTLFLALFFSSLNIPSPLKFNVVY